MPCRTRWNREYYHRSPKRRANQRRWYVMWRYGTTLEDLEKLLHEQGGCCAICRRPWQACVAAKRVRYEETFLQRLYVDHDHRSGKVRGLLCNACNTAIGLFEEDLNRFELAMAYLKRSSAAVSDA